MRNSKRFFRGQNLGDLSETIRSRGATHETGVQALVLNDDSTHADAMEDFREVLDEHYGDHLERLPESDDRQVIVERLVLQSDDLPYIEYATVDEKTVSERAREERFDE